MTPGTPVSLATNGRARSALAWLRSTDARTIGFRFQTGTLALFLAGTTLAVLVRIEHLSPRPTILMPNPFYRVLTLHGLVMLFWVALPALCLGLGMVRLPALLGIANLAWPRLGRAAYHAWLAGGACLVLSVMLGAPEGGITLRPPLSTSGGWAGPVAALGIACVALSSALGALSLFRTIQRHRPPDASWLEWPLMLTTLRCSAVLLVLATPVLITTMALLVVERATGYGIFDPARGGNPGLYAGLFWVSVRPASVAALLPAFGVLDELLPSFAGGQPLIGRRVLNAAVAALAGLSVAGWGEHLLTTSQSLLASAVFSAFGMLLAIPLAVIVLGFVLSLRGARWTWDAPLIFGLGMLWFLLLGLVSGCVSSPMSVTVYLHGTTFVVAHLHCLTLGVLVSGWLGGVVFYWPELRGHTPDRRQARVGAMLTVIGTNIAMLPLFVLGAYGLIRGTYEYAEEYRALEILSAVGSWVFSSGLIVILYCLIPSRRRPSGVLTARHDPRPAPGAET